MARKTPSIPLPRGWSEHVKAAVLHVISLAHVALTAARARASKSRSLRARWLRRIQVPLRREAMRHENSTYVRWYEEYRPHQGLGGQTPREV